MGRMKTKTFVVTGLAVLGLFAGGQALAAERVAPPEADAAAAAAAERIAPPEADAAAATAAALVRPDDRETRVSPVSPEQAARPDDRAVRVTPVNPTPSAVRPDDRPGVRGPGLVPEAAPAPITVVSGGFDLGDAAIGAGFALGLIGLLLFGIYAVRTRRPLAH